MKDLSARLLGDDELSSDEQDYLREVAYHNNQAILHAMDAYTAPAFEKQRMWLADRLRVFAISFRTHCTDFSRWLERRADHIDTCPF